MSVPCSLVITWWDRADLFALLHVMFHGVFVIFLYGVSGQVLGSGVELDCIDSSSCLLLYSYLGEFCNTFDLH